MDAPWKNCCHGTRPTDRVMDRVSHLLSSEGLFSCYTPCLEHISTLEHAYCERKVESLPPATVMTSLGVNAFLDNDIVPMIISSAIAVVLDAIEEVGAKPLFAEIRKHLPSLQSNSGRSLGASRTAAQCVSNRFEMAVYGIPTPPLLSPSWAARLCWTA